MKQKKTGLDSAYALDGSEQVKSLYRDWAKSYDEDFVKQMGYAMPKIVAGMFRREQGESPVLDVGCGSGAVGVELTGLRVDGLDISPEMLAVAAEKGVYSRLIEGDLLGALPLADASFRGVVSAGTFTHGHVGPKALDELTRIAAPGALFCLGINAEHYGARGFAAKLAELNEYGLISVPIAEERLIYNANHDHSEDKALIVRFLRR